MKLPLFIALLTILQQSAPPAPVQLPKSNDGAITVNVIESITVNAGAVIKNIDVPLIPNAP